MDNIRSNFNPSRLTLARKRRGLTKTKLAQAIGVDLRSVSAYESGQMVPGQSTLDAIVTELTFPESFFFGDCLDTPTADAVSFRAQSKMSAALRDTALSQGALAFQLSAWIEARFELPDADLPDFSSLSDPETAAIELRQHWGIGELPIANIIHLLEAKGVRVFSLALDADEADAFSLWRNGRPFVFLNTRKSAERGRFDAAHELGHLVLHRRGSPQGRAAEWQADAFAAAFLMPRASILAKAPQFATLEQLIRLKKVWNVSVAALVHRLHSVGLLTEWQYRSLAIELSQRGFYRKEPDGAARETSQILAKVFAVLREEGLSNMDVAKQLELPVEEVVALIFGLVTTSLGPSVGGTKSSKRSTAKLSLIQ